ncbi:L,D-transpeptidase family protein [Vibrio sp. SM6]|uniref:L,D-transpeptidase family protein n=1 Tax=Vibrio agarilyticus TaxID=2726741 RepID=A0A7X8YFW4_9VIBR|nr:L,D-transpeptidase family protein [Vibrio agarilyticus]NLS12069.1 L,D-transpeptidase family protein [Vibrio agarilyticus]
MKKKLVWLALLSLGLSAPCWAVDRVEVVKSERRMYLFDGDKVVREYHIALGKAPKGHKRQEGDNRTPEGHYTLDFVMNNSAYYRSMHITYPNAQDAQSAQLRGVSPGGDIKIHGLPNGIQELPAQMKNVDWTNGCIAITNREMDEFLRMVKRGTPISIRA